MAKINAANKTLFIIIKFQIFNYKVHIITHVC